MNDVPVMQTPGIVEVFRDVLRDFDQIVEIGFQHGGLSLLLLLIKPATCSLSGAFIKPVAQTPPA